MDEKHNRQFGIEVAKFTVYMAPPEPPPPAGFTSPFKSIQEWLFHLCDSNKPQKQISEYHFVLAQSASYKMLSVEGFNKYDIDTDVVEYKMDFMPASHKYFALPQEEFGKLTDRQLEERLLNELLEFFKSAKFQSSFFSKANSIRMGLAGQVWPR